MKNNKPNYSIRISAKEKMQLMGNLSTMLRAGIPILEAVDSLLEESKGNQQKVLETMKADLQAGTLIHQSFAKYSNSFDKVTVNLIKAAEEAGTLEVALKDVQKGIRKEMEFADKVKSALMYPIFVLVIFVGMIITMLVVVMPRISQVFTRLNMDLPLVTRIMIRASDTLMDNTLLVIGITLFIIISLSVFYKYKRRFVTNLLFSLPVISGMVRQIDLTKFARSMSLLLESGLPIVSALELAEDVVVKNDLHNLLVEARQKVGAGKRFSECLRSDKKLVPGMVIKIIEVGERTGSLDQSMKDITEMLDYEVTKSLREATAMLEPIMLVFVGISIGSIMITIIGPIYGLISSVNIR
jgi:type IV pilus assembly protein PilC